MQGERAMIGMDGAKYGNWEALEEGRSGKSAQFQANFFSKRSGCDTFSYASDGIDSWGTVILRMKAMIYDAAD